jgi:HAD superfamily hydrolase (TIGR01459 family)
MRAPVLIAGLAQIADRYDAVLCDVWGVIHNGRESFADACTALTKFQETRGPVVLISNAPRPSADVVGQLRALGVPDGAWSGFVTSGDATRSALAERAPGPAWAIGPARDAALYAGTGVAFAETPEEAAFVSATGLFDDDIETPEDFRGRLTVCAERDLLMICANPDIVVQRGDKMIYCAGALAALYETLGGKVLMAGKPHAPIYAAAYAEVERLVGCPLTKDKILAIGDGLPTDVKGAAQEGLPVLFIAGGIHAADTLTPDGRLQADKLAALLRHAETTADYAAASLRWRPL